MTERWQRLQEMVDAALILPKEDRAPFLETQADGDTQLLTEATEILHAGLDDDQFLQPLVGDRPVSRGTRIGPFEIVRTIAQGGMGVVFEALQDTPARRVALKMMRDDLVTAASRARFHYEIDVLGALNHPGIAQIYQAGLHGTIPWFAMEYVEGARPLTTHCHAEHASTDDRVALVADIADAIHFGHVKGVIHRDLKPDNLLVERSGRTKVIDFGVASVADPDRRLTTMRAEPESIVGTLAYMSPEQARGESGDARSDIYSLGVVLYELLTNRLPIDVQGTDFLTSAKRIVEEPPYRPASANSQLRGDLDAILLTALDKDPTRRYDSVAAFRQDLRRYIKRQPIEARAPSMLDRVRAFARRHRTLVAASSAILLVSLAAAVISIRFGVRSKNAERTARENEIQANKARKRASDLLSQSLEQSLETIRSAIPSIHALEGGAEAANVVITKAIADLEVLDARSDGSPRVRLALAQAVLALGDVRGNPTYANQSDRKGAREAYQRVLDILDSIQSVYATEGQEDIARNATIVRAMVYRKRAEMTPGKPTAKKRGNLERAQALLVPILGEYPPNDWARIQLAIVQRRLAGTWASMGNLEKAESHARSALKFTEAALAFQPHVSANAQRLVKALGMLAEVKFKQAHHADAAKCFDRAIRIADKLSDKDRRAVTMTLNSYWIIRAAIAMEQKDFPTAHRLSEKAKDFAVKSCEADPKNSLRRIDACMALIEWIRVAEIEHGALPDGTAPQPARARALEAAAIVERLAGGTTSRMADMFCGPLRAYGNGKAPADSLGRMFGTRK